MKTRSIPASSHHAASKRLRPALVLPALLTLASLAATQPALADNCAWKGGSGNFHDKHWQNCGRPGKKDNVYIGRFPWGAGTVTVNQIEEFHDFHLDYGSTVTMNSEMLIHGNTFAIDGKFTLNQTSNLHPYLRSYSKNLILSSTYGSGEIVLNNGNLGGNMTIQSGVRIHGTGNIGLESNLLFNDGTISADLPAREIVFMRSIDGVGSFESKNGGILHFTAPSSGDKLINNGRLQLDADFVVGKDYSGAVSYGNDIDARRNVSGPGRILAADARQTLSGPRLAGTVIDFGAMRVNGKATTTLTVTNTGGQTVLRGGVKSSNSALTASNFIFALAPGASSTSTLTFSGATSGAYYGQMLNVVNNFDNVADDHLVVRANVYARAVPTVRSTTMDFGIVRKGTANVTATADFGNAANGALNDALALSYGATPTNVTRVSSPTRIAAQTVGAAVYRLNTSSAGTVHGSTLVTLASHNAEMADLALGAQTLNFTGTVTDPAVPKFTLADGSASLMGSGTSYTLDLGSFLPSSGASSLRLALLNAVPWSTVAETLNGSFAWVADAGYGFSGGPITGLSAGSGNYANVLSFDTTGLAAGTYHGVLTFNGYSNYAGLADLPLSPIQLAVSATILAVPEPAVWQAMVTGLCLVGAWSRRHRPDRRRQAASH